MIGNIGRMLKRIVIGVLLFASVLVFLILLAGRIYLGTEHAQQRIRNTVNQLIPGTFFWRLHSLSLLNGGIDLRDIRLTGAAGEDLIFIERLFLEVSWRELYRGRVFAEKLVIEKPRVLMCLDQNNDLDLAGAFVAPGPSAPVEPGPEVSGSPESGSPLLPFNILVKSLRLSNGFVRFEMVTPEKEGGREHASLDQVEIVLDNGDLLNEKGTLLLRTGIGTVDMAGVRTSIDRLQLRTTLDQNRFQPIQLETQAGRTNLKATGSLYRLWVRPLVDLDVDLDLSLAELRDALDLDFDLAGMVTAKGKIKGDPVDPEAEVKLLAQAIHAAGYPLDRLHLACRFQERYLTVRQLELGLPRGDIALTGHVDLRKTLAQGIWSSFQDWSALSYDGIISQPETAVAKLLGENKGIRGTASSTLIVQGVGVEPEQMSVTAQLEAEVKKLMVGGGIKPMDLHLSARAGLNKGRVTLEQGQVFCGENQLEASGRFDLGSHETEALVQVTATDFDRFLPVTAGPAPKGEFAMKLQLSGSAKQPLIHGQVRADHLRYESLDLGMATALFQLADGVLRLENLTLQNKRSELAAHGTLALMDSKSGAFIEDPRFEVSLSGKPIFIEDFTSELKGELTVNAKASGSFNHPEGSLSAEGRQLDLGFQKIMTARMTARLVEDQIQVTPLTLTLAPGEEIRAEGWVAFDQTYAVRVLSKGIRLGRVDALTAKGIKNETLYFDIGGCGRLDNPAMSGNAVVSGLAIKDNRFQDLRLGLKLQDRILRISGKDIVEFDGRLDLRSQDFSAMLRFDRTDLTPFIRLAGREGLFGSVQGRMTFEGNIRMPENINAAADLDELELRLATTKLLSAQQVHAVFEHGKLVLPGLHLILAEQGYLDIRGEGRLDGALDLSADGRIPLETIRLFMAEAPDDLEGELLVKAVLQGEPARPDFRAEIGFAGISFTIPELMQKLHDVSGRIDVTPVAVSLENIKGHLDTGEIHVNGKIDLAELRPARFAIKVDGYALPLTVPDMLEMLVNTEVAFSGTPEAPMLTGEIVILEGQYTKDVDLNLLELVEPSRREEPPETVTLPILENLAFDIALRHRNPFMIANNLALLSLKPDLRLYGTLARPLLSGRAEVESGTITYQKREFEVQKGLINFINPYKIEPDVMVRSSVRVRDWTIFLDVSGTPDNLKYTLRSEPSEQHADILSLIVFGKTTRELMERDASPSSQPSQLLADYIAKELRDSVKDAAGLDTLSVEYQARRNQKDPEKVKVTMGKELSRRVTLKYDVETDQGKFIQSTTAEYKFLERLLMSISQDSKGDYGGELSYRIEFR